MSAKIGEYSEEHLLKVAKGVVEKKSSDSKILSESQSEITIPKFNIKGEARNRVWIKCRINKL